MDRKYNLKLDLQFRCNNQTMKFNQFDNNTSDFFMRITNAGKLVDVEKAIVVLATIKPSGKVSSQFVDVENGLVYADLKNSMKDEIGTYTAQAMLILEDERVVTDPINYEVEEDKIFSLLNDTVEYTEEYSLLTDMLNRLSTIELSEEQRMINEAERILAEENRKIEEAKRVEAELVRQHEEADRAKYDATRESNENIRKQNESIRLSNESNRIDEEAKRVDEENKRKLAEEERNANYNFMTEDEERRRSEANAHKEAENLRVQAETNRVNEEAKRRTTEQARVSAENTRVGNENVREANEVARQNNETKRVEAETQRQSRYNSFIADAEANANEFENYTNTAKVKEEERKSNELDRKSQETKRVSNEVERISNENTRKANEVVREENETSRQNVFENKVNEIDKKIVEMNTAKDNFVSSVNTKVDTKISELDTAKSDMTNTVTNKIDEVEGRFNALTASQQQSSEVIDARDGEVSLKARLDRDIEKAKQVYVGVEGNHISTDSSSGYLKDVEILGNTVQDASNLADIRSVGDKVDGQELYEIPVVSRGKNLFSGYKDNYAVNSLGEFEYNDKFFCTDLIDIRNLSNYVVKDSHKIENAYFYNHNKSFITKEYWNTTPNSPSYVTNNNYGYVAFRFVKSNNVGYDLINNATQIEEGTQATPYEPYQEDKLTILSPVQLERVGDVADRIIEKDGVWGVEKNIATKIFNGSENWSIKNQALTLTTRFGIQFDDSKGDSILISNRLPNKTDSSQYTTDEVGISINNSKLLCFRVLKTELSDDSVNGGKKWLSQNNLLVKYQLAQPQFIPLPHDQQVKLRTFANKTNISFGCEIEGTIKAQVPKSLGATVNTHTEQISNLNKELDRVKKLEESTVSTVETESDFTTVEATSNGYFEDVKLEGKTLVNLWADSHSFTIRRLYENHNLKVRCIKPNTQYTLMLLCDKNASGAVNLKDANNDYGNLTAIGNVRNLNTPITFTTLSDGDFTNVVFRLYSDKEDIVVNGAILLEGDHTQNPPSYFEGLKSVGDGADEIVVSSVNKNFIDIVHQNEIIPQTGVLNERTSESWQTTSLIKLKKNNYVFSTVDGDGDGYTYVYIYDLNGGYKGIDYRIDLNTSKKNITLNEDCLIRISSRKINTTKFQLEIGSTLTNYEIKKQDKKRLLYYNEETQTWEKPILRQWDSIEKHADGKYYYHQRSAEKVLNGSENWETWTTTTETLMRFAMSNIGKVGGRCISNIFKEDITQTGTKNNGEGVRLDGAMSICIEKSKLTTQDVAGFKQWLQANNVTVVYQLAQEEVYECTNIDLITYANETNYIVECGAIVPKSTLKVHNNISNVVSLLQKKVSLLESNITSYMITQNRLMLASRYNADNVTFKVDYPSMMSEREVEIDYDLFKLIQDNIIVGPENYDVDKMLEIMDLYAMIGFITWEMWDYLYEVIDSQINPVIEDLEGTPEI